MIILTYAFNYDSLCQVFLAVSHSSLVTHGSHAGLNYDNSLFNGKLYQLRDKENLIEISSETSSDLKGCSES